MSGTPFDRKTGRARAAVVLALALLFGTLAPTPPAAALPSVVPAEGATALASTMDATGSLVLSGSDLEANALAFDAIISADPLVLPEGYDAAELELVNIDAPSDAAVSIHDASGATFVEVGGVRGALVSGTSVSTTWTFTDEGAYRLTFRAVSSASAGGAPELRSEDTTVSVNVRPTPAAEQPAEEIEPSPEPSSPGPTTTPEPVATTTPVPEPTPTTPGDVAAAPTPGVRQVFSKIHTDAVATYFDNGHIQLASKADLPGQPVGQRFDPETVVFNIESTAKTSPPGGSDFAFLGNSGSTIWIAPQRQDHSILWPGFSTEDPNLIGKLDGNRVSYALGDVTGPGFVEIFQTTEFGGAKRLLSSRDKAISSTVWDVPVHAHANWAFSAEGRYELTFTATATVNGVPQSSTNRYVFHVGDIAKLSQQTTTTLTSSTTLAEPGSPLVLTATTAARSGTASYQPAGSVEFYQGPQTADSTSLKGFRRVATVPVVDGRAEFATQAGSIGTTSYVSKFVPKWGNEFSGSTSRPTAVKVSDDVGGVVAPPYASLTGESGQGIRITSPQPVFPGDTVRVSAPQRAAGDTLAVWLVPRDGSPVWLQWHLLDSGKAFVVTVPKTVAVGSYRLAAKTDTDTLVGWDALELAARPDPSPPPAPPGPGPGPGPGPSNPVAPPAAAAPICAAPALTLETGHIDAFNVTAQNGQLNLQLKEDVTGSHVLRTPEAVLLKVKEQAYNGAIPAAFPGSPSGYVLPLTQNANLIWPGWDTNGTSGSGYTDVTINISSATGPGRIHLYTLAGFGAVSSVLQGGGFSLPGSIREPAPAHTHAQWTFTERGVYKLTANAVATNPATGASIRSAPRTYVIQVGDVPLGDAFCGLNVGESNVSTAAAVGNRTGQDAAAAAAAAQAAAAAAAAAEAAEQSAADEAEAGKKGKKPTDGTVFAPLVDAFSSGSPSAYGIVIGGGLMIVGIAIGTTWYVRRRHRQLESP